MSLTRHLRRRARLLFASIAGVCAGVLMAGEGFDGVSAALMGWDVAALVYLVPTWRIFLTADHERLRALASEEDESREMILLLIVGAIAASLVAVAWTLFGSTHGGTESERFKIPLAGATIVQSWLLLNTVFTAHYAHRYFESRGKKAPGKGLEFPGDDALHYTDFVYFGFCVGMTFQVSDVDVTTRSMRNLITLHAVVSYFFYTFVLALAINMLSGLIGK